MTALNYLLTSDDLPYECCDCPFGTPAANAINEPNPSDPAEGDYDCALLGPVETACRNNTRGCWTFGLTTVWGEGPKCLRADWRLRAREELAQASVSESNAKGGT